MNGGFKTANGKSINIKEESLKFVKEKIFEKTDETEPINLNNLGKKFFLSKTKLLKEASIYNALSVFNAYRYPRVAKS
jgi:hypothetical protein